MKKCLKTIDTFRKLQLTLAYTWFSVEGFRSLQMRLIKNGLEIMFKLFYPTIDRSIFPKPSTLALAEIFNDCRRVAHFD